MGVDKQAQEAQFYLLRSSIEEIEAEYNLATAPSMSNPSMDDAIPNEFETKVPTEEVAAKIEPVAKSIHSMDVASSVETKSPVLKWIIPVLVCAILGFFAYLFFLSNDKVVISKNGSNDDGSDAAIETIFQSEFNSTESQFAANLAGTAELKLVDQSAQLSVEQDIRIYSKEYLEIDPEKLYSFNLSFEYKNPDLTGKEAPILRVGFAHFDKDKKLIKTINTIHKYFVFHERINVAKFTKDNSVYSKYGVITGVSDLDKNAFPTKAKFAKPLIFVNKGSKPFSLIFKSLKVEKIE